MDKAGYLALRVKSISNTGKVPYAFYLYSTSENRQLAVFNNPGQALKTKLVKVKPGDYCIEVLVNDASGQKISNTYMVNVMLPNNVGIPFLQVTEGVLAGFDMLIGMDIISKGDFSISCSGGKTVFSFQLPSTHEIDYVDGKMTQTPLVKAEKEPGRNDPCPCGSGKKYKHCHGKQY